MGVGGGGFKSFVFIENAILHAEISLVIRSIIERLSVYNLDTTHDAWGPEKHFYYHFPGVLVRDVDL